MACRKIILHKHNFTNIFYSIWSINRSTKYMNDIFVNHNVRRMFTSVNLNNLSTLETSKGAVDVEEFKRGNCIGNKYIVHCIEKLFDLSPIETKLFLRQYPKFKKFSCEQIEKNYKLLKEEGVSQEMIEKFPYLLTLQDVELRLEYIQQLSLDINKTAPLLMSNIYRLQKIVEYAKYERSRIPYGSRIVHMSKLLNIPEWQISAKFIQHTYITRIPIERLERVIKTLLNYGVEPKNIMSDFWALRYTPELAERRLQRAINANVSKVKGWMIRCTDEVFERCINRQIENQKILGADSSVEDYLSKRLECSIENATYLTEKYPAIVKMNISKMKEMLDYLYDQGYTPSHVCRVPRILVHSLETTKSRLQHLKQYGPIPPSLAILCKSKKDFDKYFKKYYKSKSMDKETKDE